MKLTFDADSLSSTCGDCDRRFATLGNINTPTSKEIEFGFTGGRSVRFRCRKQSSLCSLVPDGAVSEALSYPEVLQRSTRALTPNSIGFRE